MKIKNTLFCLSGSFILAFGLYHVHSFSRITEGGALGMTLLLQNCFSWSPALTGPVINLCCYALGIRTLGKDFLKYSLIATVGFSVFFSLFECFPPFWPKLAENPLLASLVGAVFVGVGVGLCVLGGGAPTGDDALAMSLSALMKVPIQWIYLFTDLSVLALSLVYIPAGEIVYSVLTVVLSGQIIGLMQNKKAAA